MRLNKTRREIELKVAGGLLACIEAPYCKDPSAVIGLFHASPGDFRDANLKKLVSTIFKFVKMGKPITAQNLQASGLSEDFLLDVQSKGATLSTEVEMYSRQLHDQSEWDREIRFETQLIGDLQSGKITLEEYRRQQVEHVQAELEGKLTEGGESGLFCLADVEPQQIRWLWPGRVPVGKLTVLDGDPGLGKSLITLELAARVSTGRPMPDGATSDLPGPAGVVLMSAEDDPADTIRPRLDAAGGDPERVAILQFVPEKLGNSGRNSPRMPTLADIGSLKVALERHEARLLVIDPLMAYLGDTDSHVDSQIRSRLAPLAELAASTGTAVVVVRHLNKRGGDGNPIYRGGGSIGIIGAARAGLLVAPDPDDPESGKRVLASTKSNLALLPPALAYKIEVVQNMPKITWLGRTTYSAAQLLEAASSDSERSALDEGRDFLGQILEDGPMAADKIQKQARKAGLSDITVRRAKKALGVRANSERTPDGRRVSGWVWSLPDTLDAQPPLEVGNEHLEGVEILSGNTPSDTKKQECLDAHLSPLGEDEHLEPGQGEMFSRQHPPEKPGRTCRTCARRDGCPELSRALNGNPHALEGSCERWRGVCVVDRTLDADNKPTATAGAVEV